MRLGLKSLLHGYGLLIRVVLVPFKLALQISSPARSLTISRDAAIGRDYQAQFKDSLTTAWKKLGFTATATGLTLSVTDNFSGANPQRLYRVLRLP